MAKPRAVIFFGPPGSGKTTQAEEFVRRFDGFEHLNIGRVIEKIVTDPKFADDPKMQEEKRAFASGGLVSSGFVINIMEDWIRSVASSGRGAVFSGNPRRLEEAQFLIPALERFYGEGATYAVHLAIREKTTYFRNTRRKICSKCSMPVSAIGNAEQQTFCKKCGGKLETRIIDTEEAIGERLRAYREITENVIPFLKASGVKIIEIDGENPPKEISDEIEFILSSQT